MGDCLPPAHVLCCSEGPPTLWSGFLWCTGGHSGTGEVRSVHCMSENLLREVKIQVSSWSKELYNLTTYLNLSLLPAQSAIHYNII